MLTHYIEQVRKKRIISHHPYNREQIYPSAAKLQPSGYHTVVVWVQKYLDGRQEIVGRTSSWKDVFIVSNTTYLGPYSGFDYYQPRVDCTNSKYIVVWREVKFPSYTYYARLFQNPNTALTSKIIITNTGRIFSPKVIALTPERFICAWIKYDSRFFDLHIKMLDGNGVIQTDDIFVAQVTAVRSYVLKKINDNSFIVVYVDDADNQMYRKIFSSEGILLSDKILWPVPVAYRENWSGHQLSIFNEQKALVVWHAGSNVYGDDLWAQSFTISNGTVRSNTTRIDDGKISRSWTPSIAADGETALILWSGDQPSGMCVGKIGGPGDHSNLIWGRVINSDGELLSNAQFLTSGSQYNPIVLRAGRSEFTMVFEDRSAVSVDEVAYGLIYFSQYVRILAIPTPSPTLLLTSSTTPAPTTMVTTTPAPTTMVTITPAPTPTTMVTTTPAPTARSSSQLPMTTLPLTSPLPTNTFQQTSLSSSSNDLITSQSTFFSTQRHGAAALSTSATSTTLGWVAISGWSVAAVALIILAAVYFMSKRNRQPVQRRELIVVGESRDDMELQQQEEGLSHNLAACTTK